MAAPTIPLNDGHQIPALGLGTWLAPPGEVGNAVKLAIDAGYRHFDCALLYSNEKEIGEAIKSKIAEGVVKREDLFITSKLWNTYHRPDLVVKGCKKTLRNFGFDYIDLYLIHWPIGFKATDQADGEIKPSGDKAEILVSRSVTQYGLAHRPYNNYKYIVRSQPEFIPRDESGNIIFSDDDYLDTWKEMEKCLELGLTKSIGVSNFNIQQLTRLLSAAKVTPVTNQVELHPYLNQKALREFCQQKNIAITAYCPLGAAKERGTKLLENPTILKIAEEVKKLPAQVVLRYLVQLGVVPIPKSTNPERLRQNISVFDFELTQEQIAEVDKLDRNGRICLIEGSEGHKYFPF